MSDAEIGKVLRRGPDTWARAMQDHLAIKTATGPITGCQCGQLRLGQSYIEHLRAALPQKIALAAPAMGDESVAAAWTPRWRAGHRVAEHLYRDEIPVATMPAHVVAEIVTAMEERADLAARPAAWGPEPAASAQLRTDAAADWSDYRADYGWPSHITAAEAHRLFLAGWAAHRDGDTRGPLR